MGVRRCHLSLYHFQANERRIDVSAFKRAEAIALKEHETETDSVAQNVCLYEPSPRNRYGLHVSLNLEITRPTPSLSTLKRLAKALKVKVRDLFADE